MFTRIIRFATRFPKSVIVAWAIVALALGSLSGMLGYKVMTDDTAGYLPASAESAQAARYGEEHFGTQKGARTVVVLVKRATAERSAPLIAPRSARSPPRCRARRSTPRGRPSRASRATSASAPA